MTAGNTYFFFFDSTVISWDKVENFIFFWQMFTFQYLFSCYNYVINTNICFC